MNLTKRQMQNYLIVASLPFFVVAYNSLDFSIYLPTLEDREQCEVYHENHPVPEAKCGTYDNPSRYFHADAMP